METPRMMKVRGDGVDIQLAEWPGQGRPVFCIHGLTANCRCFDLTAAGLAPDHRVLAPDLRGRGLSDKPDTGYSLEHHARDVVAVLENLGLDKTTLLGHSLGAYICLAATALRPDLVEAVILVDGGAPLSAEQWAKVTEGIKPSLERLKVTAASFEEYIAPLKAFPVLGPWHQGLEDYFRYESMDEGGRVRSRINPAHIEEEAGNMLKTDTNRYYPQIKRPVLILRATMGMAAPDDLVLPEPALAALQKSLPQARVVNLEGTNHYTMILQPNQTRDRAVKEFLKEL